MSIDSQKIIPLIKLGRIIIHSVFLLYLLGALFAVIVGARFDLVKFLFVYLILFTGTLSAMYTNNYNDVNVDKHATQTVFSGGSRILVEHPELLKIAKQLSLSFLGISIALGAVGMFLFSYPVTFFVFIVFGNVLGWYYTAPPVKLMYHGLGEICTMLAVGFILPGLGYFALAGQINASYVVLLVPLLFQGFSMSFYLELPDREADRLGHKNTLVVRYGALFGFVLGAVSTVLATICFFIYGFFNVTSSGINYWLVGLFSLLPLFFCLYSLVIYRADTTKVDLLAFRAVVSFFIFYIVLVGYFLFVIFRS